MRYAIVIDGVVVNSILWDGKADLSLNEGELVECKDDYTGSIGSTWDGKKFTNPVVTDAAE
jgi:hypothetical protein